MSLGESKLVYMPNIGDSIEWLFKNRISDSRNTFSVRFGDTECGIALSEKCCNFLIFNLIPHQSILNERSFSVESKFR